MDQALKPYLFTSPKKSNLEPSFSIVVHEFFMGGRGIHFLLLLPSFIKCSWGFFPQSFGKRLLIFILFLFPHHFCAKLSFLGPNFFFHPLKLGNIQIWVLGSFEHFCVSFIKVRGIFPLLEPWYCYLWKLDFIACCVDVQIFVAIALDGNVWYVVFIEVLRLKMISLVVKT